LFYTLVESAKLNGVDPRKYLRHAAQAALTSATVMLPSEYAARFGCDADVSDDDENAASEAVWAASAAGGSQILSGVMTGSGEHVRRISPKDQRN
jgi:hypothetical protein